MNSLVAALNRRLGESLGFVCGGTVPRFAWLYAPDQPFIVYDRDNRTLLKKSWADSPSMDGGTLGRVWLLAEWRVKKPSGTQAGVRIPFVSETGYSPYLETALAPGEVPTEALNANYIWALDVQLQRSAEFDQDSFDNYMTEEKYTSDRNKTADRNEWQEIAAAGYDDHVGAYGNCRPGTAGGFLSFGGL